MKSLFVSLFYSVVNPVNITHNAASAVLLACFSAEVHTMLYPRNIQIMFISGFFLACLPCIKPNTVFKILFSVPPRDPTTGQTHQRLKVNSGANQFSSLKHSSSASHCAITAQAYTHTYICTHMVNPHPSCYGGHDPM